MFVLILVLLVMIVGGFLFAYMRSGRSGVTIGALQQDIQRYTFLGRFFIIVAILAEIAAHFGASPVLFGWAIASVQAITIYAIVGLAALSASYGVKMHLRVPSEEM